MNLLTMSAAGGMIILTAVVIRALAINRLPKSAFLALWVVAAARLLIPISIPSPLSAWTPLAGLGSSAGAGRTTAAAQLSVGAFAQNQAGAGAAWSGDGTAAAHASAQADALPVWFWIWLAGACACALFFTMAYMRSMRVFRESLPVENETVAVWLAQHRLLRSVKVLCSARVSSPLTYGVLRPVLLLPGAMKDAPGEQLRYVLMHEWMHIRRFDALGKLVLAAALCAHWFNPLVWVMWVLCNRDIELSCDERVVKACGGDARRAYALTLICMEERKGAMHPLCSSFSRNAIEERITAIMKTKKGFFHIHTNGGIVGACDNRRVRYLGACESSFGGRRAGCRRYEERRTYRGCKRERRRAPGQGNIQAELCAIRALWTQLSGIRRTVVLSGQDGALL